MGYLDRIPERYRPLFWIGVVLLVVVVLRVDNWGRDLFSSHAEIVRQASDPRLRPESRVEPVDDIVLGLTSAKDYLGQNFYMGAVVGRYANRIAGGRFSIDGENYSLEANDGPHHLHGGTRGSDKRLWNGEQIQSDTGQAVRFALTSEEGDEGYPGELDVSVTYELDGRNRLRVSFTASTTAATSP